MGRFSKEEILRRIQGGLVVSCQAAPGEPFFGPDNIVRFAQAALNGGAVGIRANTIPDVSAVLAAVSVPVIGLIKQVYDNSDCYITPTMREVDELVCIESDIVAVDATNRTHPDGQTGAEFIAEIRAKYPGIVLMADISTFEEGVAAAEAGADLISTTLSGYTAHSPKLPGPDFELIEKLARTVSVPVIAEGRIWTPEELRKAYELGAFSVVIGSAVTRPHEITKRFVQALR